MSSPFNDIIQWNYRSTFVATIDTKVVNNGIILLTEIPAETDGVTISGYTEIQTNNITTSTQFYVDYTLGIVYFHSSINNTQLVINYMGTGVVLFPAVRTYITDSAGNWDSSNVEDLSAEIKTYIGSTILTLSSDLSTHINSINPHTDENVTFAERYFVVTTAFAANEVITLSTGSGASSGRSIATGNTITLNATEAEMNADNMCKFYYNNVLVRKGIGTGFRAIWDSTTSFHFNFALDKGDTFTVEIIDAVI